MMRRVRMGSVITNEGHYELKQVQHIIGVLH